MHNGALFQHFEMKKKHKLISSSHQYLLSKVVLHIPIYKLIVIQCSAVLKLTYYGSICI